jgi:methionine synthase II (cobalamin-independent)
MTGSQVVHTCLSLENLALSPQCGFASTAEGNLVSEEHQWAKLRLVQEVAREVWGYLTFDT